MYVIVIVHVRLRSAVPGQVIKGEHDTRFEPVLNRYRRAPGDLDEKKLACTLYMRVSCASMLFCIIKESYQALETVFYQVSYFQLCVPGNMVTHPWALLFNLLIKLLLQKNNIFDKRESSV